MCNFTFYLTAFIDANNVKEIDFDQLKRMTNFNPLLLQEVKKTKRQHITLNE